MRRIFLLATTVGMVAGVGCVHYHHTGYDTALRSVVDHPIKPAYRSQVHLFVLSGVEAVEDVELVRLRDEVVKAGYPMVHLAQRSDADFYHREMHRLVREQPASRFVLVGYGLAAGRTRELACTASGDGLPIDAVVLLDPAGGPDIVDERVPITIVRSHRWPFGRDISTTHVTECVGIGHLSLPAAPQTVSILTGLLADSATRVGLDSPPSLPHLPLTEFPPPTPRPLIPVVVAPKVEMKEK